MILLQHNGPSDMAPENQPKHTKAQCGGFDPFQRALSIFTGVRNIYIYIICFFVDVKVSLVKGVAVPACF
jgi:hypothetical protein